MKNTRGNAVGKGADSPRRDNKRTVIGKCNIMINTRIIYKNINNDSNNTPALAGDRKITALRFFSPYLRASLWAFARRLAVKAAVKAGANSARFTAATHGGLKTAKGGPLSPERRGQTEGNCTEGKPRRSGGDDDERTRRETKGSTTEERRSKATMGRTVAPEPVGRERRTDESRTVKR